MAGKVLSLAVALLSVAACASSKASPSNTSGPADAGPAPSKFLAFHNSPLEESSPDVAQTVDMTSKEMEAAITDLMLGKTAFGATPMGGSVKKIADILTKTMLPKVTAAHKSDQKTMDRLRDELAKCSSTKNSALKSSKAPLGSYRANSKSHKTCRNNQAVMYSSKMACLDKQRSLYKEKGLKCDFFATIGRKFGTQKENIAVMKKAGSETTEGYITRISATVCGKHIHGSKGTKSGKGGWGGGLPGSFLDKYLKAKDACEKAKKKYQAQVKLCKAKVAAWNVKTGQCNQYQTLMDSNSCKGAILVKDLCEAYAGCYDSKKAALLLFMSQAIVNELDRKAEWRGLKRMSCLIDAFADGKVTNAEVDTCKKRTVSTSHLSLRRPKIPARATCALPTLYPATGAYKRAEFVPLPTLAKGKESVPCSGMDTVSTTPMKGSPSGAKCERVALNGYYSAGALVKCTNGHDTRRAYDKNSCPEGTKIFSPASREDWKTFLASAGVLQKPHFIFDVTRPANGCGGCTGHAMNSANRQQKSWVTSDGSPWWLRSKTYSEPNGDYHANCYMHLWHGKPKNENSVTFNDGSCNYHSRDYYCQPRRLSLKPKTGPASCKCSKVDLTGSYTAGLLVKCSECTSVSKSTQRNSCPHGMKIFSPQSRQDWNTFLSSAGPLYAPHWIVDVTRPQNGCGGCTRYSMKSTTPSQATWKTSDSSPWWLRSTVYSEPNGDYTANCFLGLSTPSSSSTVRFNDGGCAYHSRSYYCQPKKGTRNYGGQNKRVAPKKTAPAPAPKPPPAKKVKKQNGKYKYTGSYTHITTKGACATSKTWHKRWHCDYPLHWCKKMCSADKNCNGYVQSWSPTACQMATTTKKSPGSKCRGPYDSKSGKISKHIIGGGYGGCWVKR